MNKYHGRADKPVVLYVLKNPRSDVYVGITNNLERRLRQHKENKRDAFRRLGYIMKLHHHWGPFTITEAPVIELALQRYADRNGGLAVLKLAALSRDELVGFLEEYANAN